MCGESITDKAWTEAPSDDQYRQSIEYFSVCLKLFLLFKNSIINKYGLVYHKVLIVYRNRP